PCPPGKEVQSVKVGFAVAEGCFTERKDAEGHATGVFATDQTAWVGGFQVEPLPGGTFVVDAKAVKLSEEGAGAPIVMDGCTVPFPVSVLPVGVPEGAFDLNQPGTVEKALLGMPVKGKGKAAWSEQGKGSSLEGELSVSKLIGSLGSLVSTPSKGLE